MQMNPCFQMRKQGFLTEPAFQSSFSNGILFSDRHHAHRLTEKEELAEWFYTWMNSCILFVWDFSRTYNEDCQKAKEGEVWNLKRCLKIFSGS